MTASDAQTERPMPNHDVKHDPAGIVDRLRRLGLNGFAAGLDVTADLAALLRLVDLEEADRKRRSFERRARHAKIGAFKPLSAYDWTWPSKIDRVAVDEVFSLGFIEDGTNVVLAGPNGIGKTMLLRNLAHHAVVSGMSVRVVTASEMLADLAAQESTSALRRRLRRYTVPRLLCVDEVGYLSYDSRYADLFFEVVTHRYEAKRPIALTTNKAFSEWSEVFPHAACVVTLVDRLTHRADVLTFEGKSYRLKEAEEMADARKKRRRGKTHAPG
jgi:DNA replication protein DnaC